MGSEETKSTVLLKIAASQLDLEGVMYVMSLYSVPTPAGWSLTTSLVWTPYGCCYNSYAFTRQVGSDTSVSLSLTNGGAIIAAYQGASGVGAVGSWWQSSDADTVVYGVSITPQSVNGTIVGIAAERDPVNPVPGTAGFTSRVSQTFTYFGQNFADKSFGSVSPTGNVMWTQSPGYDAVAVLIELKP